MKARGIRARLRIPRERRQKINRTPSWMLRGCPVIPVIRPKLAELRSVLGLPQFTMLKALKKSAWTWSLTSSLIPNCLRSEMSQTWYEGPSNWPRSLLPRRPSGAEAKAARFSHCTAPVVGLIRSSM